MAENMSFRSSMRGFNRNDVIEYIKKLLDENNALLEEKTALEVNLAEKEQLLLQQEQTLAQMEEEKKNGEQDAARLGEAMFEAKRFSDRLMREANDRVERLFDEVSQVTDASENQLQGLIGQMDQLSEEVHMSMSALSDKLAALEQVLGGFGGDALTASRQLRRQFEEDLAKTYGSDQLSAPENMAAQPSENASGAGSRKKALRVRIVKK